MVLCGSWLWQWCIGVSAVLVLMVLGVVVVVSNGRGWWLCCNDGCTVMVGAVAGDGRGWRVRLLAKEKERRIIRIQYNL
jgi:hypothetical protein